MFISATNTCCQSIVYCVHGSSDRPTDRPTDIPTDRPFVARGRNPDPLIYRFTTHFCLSQKRSERTIPAIQTAGGRTRAGRGVAGMHYIQSTEYRVQSTEYRVQSTHPLLDSLLQSDGSRWSVGRSALYIIFALLSLKTNWKDLRRGLVCNY